MRESPTMRLLNAKTLALETFLENALPAYAILSHTWGDEEITFEDAAAAARPSRDGDEDAQKQEKAGFQKIRRCCDEALRDGLSHVWVDTCCIDKSSSAELSEAINSMFRWYQGAAICYALLDDVTRGPAELAETEPDPNPHPRRGPSATKRSRIRWFTRGWTLQELLAPSYIRFFGRGWTKLGTKHDLVDYLVQVTGISQEYLHGEPLASASVAERMSWASQRDTTRPEDMAYSLMGIFDVNMPLLYGEGAERAFSRLQEQIIKTTDDQSILAWGLPTAASGRQPKRLQYPSMPYSVRPLHMDRWGKAFVGVLALSPSDFCGSSVIERRQHWNTDRVPHFVTCLGVETAIPILDDVGILACGYKGRSENLGVPLRRIRGIWYRRSEDPPHPHVRPSSSLFLLFRRLLGSPPPRVILATKPWQFTDQRRYPWLLRNLPCELTIAEVSPKSCFSCDRRLVFTSSKGSSRSSDGWMNQASDLSQGGGPELATSVKIKRWVRFSGAGQDGEGAKEDLLLTLTLESCLAPREETALFDYGLCRIPSTTGSGPGWYSGFPVGSKTVKCPADGRTIRLLARSRWINNKRVLVVDFDVGRLSLASYLLCEAEHALRAIVFRHGVKYYQPVRLSQHAAFLVAIPLSWLVGLHPLVRFLHSDFWVLRLLIFLLMWAIIELAMWCLEFLDRYAYFTWPDLLRHSRNHALF